ncbi:hypothetical protein [Micromonospora parathelypteridis]|uniref:Uncharacterized protein n=1 Tax=Micromonospora parathelypteridis TaxID=1839617 RepID=A0A840VPD9_9ACTN|nr:hypothetical protein [Micromonospora parathelypteridis]
MSDEEVSIVFCVSADASVLERVLRQLDGAGSVVSCADLTQLRAILFPPSGGSTPPVRIPPSSAAGPPDRP